MLSSKLGKHMLETGRQRKERIAEIAKLVKSGEYSVDPCSLASALTSWPGEQFLRGERAKLGLGSGSRNAYMREYMRLYRLAGRDQKPRGYPGRRVTE